jgi:hypothetical protein
MTGRLSKHLSYANVTATLALFIAMGGTAAASVIVHSNSDIARKTVSGHEPPAGSHANLIAGSVNATDLAPDLTASLQLHCPTGLQHGSDICFDPEARSAKLHENALATCQNLGQRLPSLAELAEIFDHTGAPQDDEWTDEIFENGDNIEATTVGDNPGRVLDINFASVFTDVAFRCVVGPGS